MVERSIEFWVALFSAAAYVFLNSKERAIHYRVLMVASSAGFGFSLAGDLSERTGMGESLSNIIIVVFGYVLIDAVTAIVADREFVKEWIKGRLK